jgi:hypothetical protein
MKAHRDISFNNILITEDREWPDTLSDLDSLRKQNNCRRGLLIDFDYASDISSDIPTQGTTNPPSVNRTVSVARLDALPWEILILSRRAQALSWHWSYFFTVDHIEPNMTWNPCSMFFFSSAFI